MPDNGDWLFVTETPANSDTSLTDLAAKYDTPIAILHDLKSDDTEVLKLVYERAKDFEAAIYKSADNIREKAGILLSSKSLIVAAVFGVTGFFLSAATRLSPWLLYLEIFLFLFVVMQLASSIVNAISVMRKEEFVRTSPGEFLGASQPSLRDSAMVLRQAISQTVAYANQTHDYILERGNKLIRGQSAFKYGIIYFTLFCLVHVLSTSFLLEPPRDPFARFLDLGNKIVLSSNSHNEEQSRLIKEFTQELALFRRTTELVVEELREIDERIGDIKIYEKSAQAPSKK